MRSAQELVRIANENFVASFRKLAHHCAGGESLQIAGATAYVTGLPLALFNGCAVVDPTTPAELHEAIAWVESRHVPMRVFIGPEHEARLAAVPVAHGLERNPVPYPGMVLHPLPEPPEPARRVEVVPLGRSSVEEFRSVGVAGGLPPELLEAIFPPSFFDDGDVDAFVARLQDRAVGHALAIRTEQACGIYNVGTIPDARRRGVGTTLTWAAVESGRAAGLDCAVLQASEMAEAMYAAMGFRTLVAYATFGAPATAGGRAGDA